MSSITIIKQGTRVIVTSNFCQLPPWLCWWDASREGSKWWSCDCKTMWHQDWLFGLNCSHMTMEALAGTLQTSHNYCLFSAGVLLFSHQHSQISIQLCKVRYGFLKQKNKQKRKCICKYTCACRHTHINIIKSLKVHQACLERKSKSKAAGTRMIRQSPRSKYHRRVISWFKSRISYGIE